jgi:hypothetical protein
LILVSIVRKKRKRKSEVKKEKENLLDIWQWIKKRGERKKD